MSAEGCERCGALRSFVELDDGNIRCTSCGFVRGPFTVRELVSDADMAALGATHAAGGFALNVLHTPQFLPALDVLERGIAQLSDRRARGLLTRIETALATLEEVQAIVADHDWGE